MRLQANAIGGPGNALKVSGTSNLVPANSSFPNVARSLSITNFGGDSYVNEIGVQLFRSISLQIAGQANSTQQVLIMGNPGGETDVRAGTGHILLNTDGLGTLNLAAGDIDTSGVPGVIHVSGPEQYSTSVTLTAPTMTFANGSVNLGGTMYYAPYSHYPVAYSYEPVFTASASHSLTSSAADGIADITAANVHLSGPMLGSLESPVEMGSGTSLTLNNTGGSSYVRALEGGFSSLNLTGTATDGSHFINFASGEFVSATTSAEGIRIQSVSEGDQAYTTFDTTGVRLNGRSLTLNQQAGDIILEDSSVNLDGGAFAAATYHYNTAGSIRADSLMPGVAQVTAGDVSLSLGSPSATGSIKDLHFAHGGASLHNRLTLSAYQGDISVHEVDVGHFKTLNVNLYGGNIGQTVVVDLAGADQLQLSDDGTRMTLDANAAATAEFDRNFSLSATGRTVQVDGVAVGQGDYSVNARKLLLNSDVVTDGGSISLIGHGGIELQRSVLIGSNANSLGASGSVMLQGTLSAASEGLSFKVDSASTDSSGGGITSYVSASNGAGHFLAGVSYDATGFQSSRDGQVNLQNGNYMLNGDFAARGNTYLSSTIIDTEQGDLADAGNITFSGANLSGYYYGNYRFDASTKAAGGSGGNVDLYSTTNHGTLSGVNFIVDTRGGIGGHDGSIDLPSVTTLVNGYGNHQTYQGGVITLHGNLLTANGNVQLLGDTRLATDVLIDTWQNTPNSNGRAGSVSIGQVSAMTEGVKLTVDTSTNTGQGYFGLDGDWSQTAGNVSVESAGAAGGHALDSLNITSLAAGLYNLGLHGDLKLGSVLTKTAQSYDAGAIAITGALASDSLIRLAALNSDAAVTASGSISTDSLLLQGSRSDFAFNAANQVNQLTGTGLGDLTFDNANALTVGHSGLSATGDLSISTQTGDLTLAGTVATASASEQAIVLNAGSASSAGDQSGGDIRVLAGVDLSTGIGGRATLYTGSLEGSSDLADHIGQGSERFRYNSDEAQSRFSSALGEGAYLIYRQAPVLTLTVKDASKTYDGTAFAGNNGHSIAGSVNGDSGSLSAISYNGNAQGAVDAGQYAIGIDPAQSSVGYLVKTVDGKLVIDQRDIEVTATAASKTYGEADKALGWSLTAGNLVSTDTLSGNLSRAGGENVGSYAISQGALGNANYAIQFVDGVLNITPRAIEVTATSNSKVYGEKDMPLGWSVTAGNLVATDTLAGNLTRESGENAGGYAIGQGSLVNANYEIKFIGGQLQITPRPITVTADSVQKTAGSEDPELTWGVTAGNLLTGDTLQGQLARTPGDAAGGYAIGQGSLNNRNYAIDFINGTFTINAPVQLTNVVREVEPHRAQLPKPSFVTPVPRNVSSSNGDMRVVEFSSVGKGSAEKIDYMAMARSQPAGMVSVFSVDGGIRLPVGEAQELSQ